jgi:hypothetical protein
MDGKKMCEEYGIEPGVDFPATLHAGADVPVIHVGIGGITGHIDRRFEQLVGSLTRAENLAVAKRLGIIKDNRAPLTNLKPRGEAAQGVTP